MSDDRLTAAGLRADRRFDVEHGGIHKPFHTSVQVGFERVEDRIGVFQGTLKRGYDDARQGTPTSAALEAKITALGQGVGMSTVDTAALSAVEAAIAPCALAWSSAR